MNVVIILMSHTIYVYYSGNYNGYDPTLNVIHMGDLINDLYAVYTADPAYCFISVDVRKMFDEIPMSSVLSVIASLDNEFEYGFINKALLLKLVKKDSDYFNYFRYYDHAANGGRGKCRFCQSIILSCVYVYVYRWCVYLFCLF